MPQRRPGAPEQGGQAGPGATSDPSAPAPPATSPQQSPEAQRPSRQQSAQREFRAAWLGVVTQVSHRAVVRNPLPA